MIVGFSVIDFLWQVDGSVVASKFDTERMGASSLRSLRAAAENSQAFPQSGGWVDWRCDGGAEKAQASRGNCEEPQREPDLIATNSGGAKKENLQTACSQNPAPNEQHENPSSSGASQSE